MFEAKNRASAPASASSGDGVEGGGDLVPVDLEVRLAARGDGDERDGRSGVRNEGEVSEADALARETAAQPGPQASSPAPPASSTSAPSRAAWTATLAVAPPGWGTNDRASTSASPRQRVGTEREDRRMRTRTSELAGMPVRWYEGAADGPGARRALLLHGLPSSGAQWEPFLDARGGLAPDLPGFGQTGKPGYFSYDFAGYAGWLEAFAEQSGLEEPFDLVVHGWGAVGLPWALARPERVRRLVLLAPQPLLPDFRWGRAASLLRRRVLGESAIGFGFRPVFDRALERLHGGPLPADFKRARWADFDPGTQRAVLRLLRAGDPETLAREGRGLSSFPGEVLLAWGAVDGHLGPEWAGAYAERFPQAEVRIARGAGHWQWLDDPDVVGAVSRFLA